MTERLQVYKCELCVNIVVVVHEAAGKLVCCGQPMELQEENTVDVAKEKHVPVIEESGDKINVRVGSVAHPMTEEHYIEWIELVTEEKSFRKFLKPGDKPEAKFCKPDGKFYVRAYCNLHGLWKGE